MSSKLGPVEIRCDAPAYLIVKACQTVGFQAPLDVRWCRMSQFLDHEEGASAHFWSMLFSRSASQEKTCRCGAYLPILENYAFTFACERVVNYRLGQCPRCRTIYWDDASVL